MTGHHIHLHRHGAWRALVTATVVGLVVALPASAQVERNTKPLTPFRIDIHETIANSTMPFDAKFILWGDVPAGTTEVELIVRTVKKDGAGCSSETAGTEVQRTTAQPRKWKEADYTKHDASPPQDIGTQTDLQFELVVKELGPSTFYCFAFGLKPGKRMTSAEAAGFGATLLPAYQAFLSAHRGPLSLPQSDVEPLRQEFLRVLKAASRDRLTPVTGTLFDPNADPAVVAPDFVANTVTVFDWHLDVGDRLVNVNTGAGRDGARRLSALVTAAKARTFTGLSPTQQAAVDFFRSLTEARIRDVLLGVTPGGPPGEPLLEVWTPDRQFPSSDDPDFGPATPCPVTGDIAPRCRELARVLGQLAQMPSLDGNIAAGASESLELQRTAYLLAQNGVNRRAEIMALQLSRIQGSLPEYFLLLTTTTGSAETRRAWYLSLDNGIAIAPAINEVFPYVGTNLYFRPVNTAVPPSTIGTRLAMLFGFTWTSNLTEGPRHALYGDDAMIVLGAGLRASEFLRFTVGALVFKGDNANPLISKTRIETTPFISISADIDVARAIGGLFGNDATPPSAGRTLAPK